MAWDGISRKTAAAAGVLGVGAMLLAACGTRDFTDRGAQSFNTGGSGAPMSVACEPNQRAIVRQAVVNGVATPQVECSSVAGGAALPAAYQPGVVPVNYGVQPAYGYMPAVENTRLVRTGYPVTRDVAPRRVVYQRAPERVVRSGRSWQKSALIIGSSAGIGAGVGAAIHGKKGALIGAALGGGGATIWDQLTRRNR